jgi:tRNA A37 threonylcarbamoyladenosine modification protein TsaB
MTLFIDTTTNKKIFLMLANRSKIIYVKKINLKNNEDSFLPAIQNFLNLSNLEIQKIFFLAINVGPKNQSGKLASFSGTRAGAAFANAIKMSQKINLISISLKNMLNKQKIFGLIQNKIEQKKFSKIILPKYSHEPNITRPKKTFAK